MPKYWMNVDKPLKSAILHQVHCIHVPNKRETEFKGIDEMRRDGGWFASDTSWGRNASSTKRFAATGSPASSHATTVIDNARDDIHQ